MKTISLIIFFLISLTQYLFSREPFDKNFRINEISQNGYTCDNLISDESDSLGYVGKRIPSERLTWIDDTTGYEITQWTNTGSNYHPYFTTESFLDDETVLIYSHRTGRKQLYKLDLITGEMLQMTVADNLKSIDHLPKFKTVWYFDGKVLRELNTSSLISKEVYDFNHFQYDVGSFSVTCDAKWFVFGVNKKVQTPEDLGYGPYAIYKLNLEDKSITQITMDLGFNIGHIQTNPTDPNLIMYCWQWEKFDRPLLVGHAPIRIWWVNLSGTDGGPLTQHYGTQRTHETWTADGKYIAYISKYRIGTNARIHFLGLQSIDGKVNKTYPAQVSPGHQNLFKDNKHWIVDLYNNEEPLLVMFTRGEDRIEETKVLFHHNSTMVGQNSHPHPRFSPNGKYILFTTDRTGTAQVYTVRIKLNESQKVND
jgi:oligogalacturonide lyase